MALPDSLSYHVVFDISRRLPQDWWIFILPIGIVYVVARFSLRAQFNQHRLFKRIFVGFAIVLSLGFGWGTWGTGCRLRSALVNGDVRVIEGIVNDFIPQRWNYKYPEQFVVVTPTGRYKYSYFSAFRTGGLCSSHGYIRNGVRVRIADRDGIILRLEVARDASGKPAIEEGYPEVAFLPPVYVRYGSTVNVPHTKDMSVRFVDVVSDTRFTDSEGPGDAVAIVELFDREVGHEPIRLELHTNRELYSPFKDGDLVVDLTHLGDRTGISPGESPSSKSGYIARLMIGRRKATSE